MMADYTAEFNEIIANKRAAEVAYVSINFSCPIGVRIVVDQFDFVVLKDEEQVIGRVEE